MSLFRRLFFLLPLFLLPAVCPAQDSQPTIVPDFSGTTQFIHPVLIAPQGDLSMGAYTFPAWVQPQIRPTAFKNLELWFKSDDLTANYSDGSSITMWADASGNGNDAFAAQNAPAFCAVGGAGSNDSIGGHPTVQFTDTNQQYLSLSSGLSLTRFTMFAVVKIPPGKTLFVFGGDPNNYQIAQIDNMRVDNATAIWTYSTSSGQAATSGYVTGLPAAILVEVTQDSGQQYFRINGTLYSSVASTSTYQISTISSLPGQSAYGDGDVAEMILYSSALNSGDSAQIREYLRAKYNLY